MPYEVTIITEDGNEWSGGVFKTMEEAEAELDDILVDGVDKYIDGSRMESGMVSKV